MKIDTYYAIVRINNEHIVYIDDDAEKVAHDMYWRKSDHSAKMIRLKVDEVISKRVITAWTKAYEKRFEKEADETK